MFSENLINNYKKILYILYIYIFTFWLLNIYSVNITKYLPDSLYYIKNLSIYYWLGITLIAVVLILNIYIEKESSVKIGAVNHFLFIILTVLYLYGTTSFLYSNARALDVFAYTYLVDNIETQILRTYPMYFTQFEGSTLMFAMIFQYTKINSLEAAKYYPIFLMSMIAFLVYVIAKKASNKYYIIAPFAYLSLGWVQEYHISPQSHAIMLAIILFYLLTLFLKKSSNDLPIILLIMITWAAICISHALTPILILMSLIITCLLIKLGEKMGNTSDKFDRVVSPKTSKLYKFLAPFIVIYLINALNSSVVIERMISISTDIQSNLRMGNMFNVVDRAVSYPSESYLFGYNLRIAVLFFTIISGLICLFRVYSIKRNIYYDTYFGGTFLGYLVAGMSFIVVGYNIYGFDRCYMLLLIPYSILCAMFLDTNKCININFAKAVPYSKIFIIVFILSSMILLPVTQNASDPYNFLSDSERAGKTFCFKFNNDLVSEPANQIFPTATVDSFYTFHYNYIEMKTQQGSEYLNKIDSMNIIYNSGQYKTSKVMPRSIDDSLF